MLFWPYLKPSQQGITGFDTFKANAEEEEFKNAKHEKKGMEHACEQCNEKMYENKCKTVCPNCGNKMDCSDLF